VTKELRDAELKESELFAQQQVDRGIVTELEQELKAQEAQHVADARAVKMKITELQDALQEKVNTVEQLTRATQATKVKARHLQDRLEQTEAEAAQAQQTFEKMIDEEQLTSANLRAQLEKATRAETTFRSQMMNKSEKLQLLQSKLMEKQSETEVLQHEVYAKGREAHQSELELEKLTSRERDMMDSIKDMEETIVELKLQQREREKVEHDLTRQVKATATDNKMMKRQVAEKVKTEQILLAELEAKRLGVTATSGRSSAEVSAHRQAEESLQNLMHQLNDKSPDFS
jgi:chromosome segregation ATPase